MGTKRSLDFDSVIGIGGIGRGAEGNKINHKINWVGIGARQVGWCRRGPLLAFDHVEVWEHDGPDAFKIAPNLADIFCSPYPVVHLQIEGFTKAENDDINRVLDLGHEFKGLGC